MLSAKMQKALNDQIALEAAASDVYLAMASWCDARGLPGAAQFMYAQSEEERQHMLKLFHYTNDTGGVAVVSGSTAPTKSYKGLLQVFEVALKHEQKVTKAIHKLVDVAHTTKDYSTFNFLQWYVAEQHEEEKQFSDLIDMIKLAGNDKRAEFFADRELAKLAGEHEGAAAAEPA